MTAVYSLLVVTLSIYFIGAFHDMRRAFEAYRALPYCANRQHNRHIRLQVTAPTVATP